jgi:phosphoribosyl 1,2-cyclic phosphodiesterase
MNNFNIKFKSIASGSGGNCYLLEGKESKILLECGIPIAKINEATNHTLSEIDACFVSHAHKDHSKAIFDVASRGVEVHALTETLKDFPKHHRYNSLKFRKTEAGRSYQPIKVGDEFTVYPFPVEHDVENVGYLIQSHLSGEKLLFVIDTFYVKYKFTGITHFCMEANYCAEILAENIEKDDLSKKYVDRIYKSHFSLENLCDFFDANDLTECKEIHLMHMSSTNGDAKLFKNVVETKTGKPVTVCGV